MTLVLLPRFAALPRAAFVAGAMLFSAFPANAQSTTTTPSSPMVGRSPEATRPDLEARLQALQGSPGHSPTVQAQSQTEAATIRDRLTNGDFEPGDRIVVYVANQPALSDTFEVRQGQLIHLPNLGDVSLHGVLRSELQPHIYAEISRYVRDPVVRTGSLLRVSVLGEVQHAGFYAMPADLLLSDAIMRAGGLGGNSDVSRTEIKRGGEIIVPMGGVQAAVRDGETLDQLNLRDGDAIVVGEKHHGNGLIILSVVATVVGIATAVILVTKH
jgi:protein involved in polysaccharide export with SLBB domain